MSSSKMATFVLTRNDVNTAVTSYSLSQKFMRVLFQVAVTNIIYHRLIIDESHFVKNTYEGIEYMLFEKWQKQPLCGKFRNSMKGAVDSFDRGYLEEFNIVFKCKENEIAVEIFKFKFQYFPEGIGKVDIARRKLKNYECTKELLEGIKSLERYSKWDIDEIDIMYCLVQTDDTPIDYTPRCYKTNDASVDKTLRANYNFKTMQPAIDTGYHGMSIVYYSEKIRDVTPTSTNVIIISDENTSEEEEVFETVPESTPAKFLKSPYSELSTISESDHLQKTDLLYEIKGCICNTSIVDKNLEVFECHKCKGYFHAACFSYLSKNDLPRPFVCGTCAELYGLERVDSVKFTNKSSDLRVKVAALRLSAAYILNTGRMPDDILRHFSVEVQCCAKEKLMILGAIVDNDWSAPYINKEAMPQVVRLFSPTTMSFGDSMLLSEDPSAKFSSQEETIQVSKKTKLS